MPDESNDKDQAQEEAPKSKLKWILMAAGVLLILVLGGVGAWASGLFDSMLGEPAAETEEVAAPQPAEEANEVVKLDPVVVNLVPGSQMSYARIGVSLGVYNPKPGTPVLNEELAVPKVKDRLLGLVGEMNSDELLKPETKETIKKDLITFVNQLIEEPGAKVEEVYFTDFIIQ